MKFMKTAACLSTMAVATWLFAATSRATTLTKLFSFGGTNGAAPVGGLIADAAGNLYGTTEIGGANGAGTVFRLEAGTNVLTTLVSFNGANGSQPRAGLLADAASNLYGTTVAGGANNRGTVFRLEAGTGTLTTLALFNGANGRSPYSGLFADDAGNLYGTTRLGGTNDLGTVFRIEAGTNTLTTLVSFNGANGATPYAGLVADAAGNLFGTTFEGGIGNAGTVFRLEAGTNVLTTLVSFDGTNGERPYAGLVTDAAGNLYGTTLWNSSTVFRLETGTGTLTTLASRGGGSFGRLLADAAGNLYGTTEIGGANGAGTVFRLEAGTNVLTTLVSFDGVNGAYPYVVDGLLADAAGNLYGTTYLGGDTSIGYGTIFRLSDVGFVIPEPGALALGLSGTTLLLVLRKHRASLVRRG